MSNQVFRNSVSRYNAGQNKWARSANQTIGHNVTTAITWDAEPISNEPALSLVAGSRITALETGIYELAGTVTWIFNATGQRQCWLAKNGVINTRIGGTASPVNTRNQQPQLQLNAVVKLEKDDYIEAYVFQNSTGNLDIVGLVADAANHTRMNVAKID